MPVPAVVTASTLNVLLMRLHELDEGIDVIDQSGNVLGTSKIAAKNALKGWFNFKYMVYSFYYYLNFIQFISNN